jgi:hypothetical protein
MVSRRGTGAAPEERRTTALFLEAHRVVDTLAAKLKGGSLPLVSVPMSLLQANFPMAWCDDVKRFVRVYEW